MRHRITIETNLAAGGADIAENWQPFVSNVPCEVRALEGKEQIEPNQIMAMDEYRFDLHYLPGVRPTMRIKYDGRVFNIEQVRDPGERRRKLQIFATERT